MFVYQRRHYSVKVSECDFREIKEVAIRYKPKELTIPEIGTSGTSFQTYTVAGALVGGLAGLVVGKFMDSLRGPKTKDISFHLKLIFKLHAGERLKFLAVDEVQYFSSDDSEQARWDKVHRSEVLSQDIVQKVVTAKRVFGDKVKGLRHPSEKVP